MYRDRFSTYIKDQKGINKDMIAFTNQVADAIGNSFPPKFYFYLFFILFLYFLFLYSVLLFIIYYIYYYYN